MFGLLLLPLPLIIVILMILGVIFIIKKNRFSATSQHVELNNEIIDNGNGVISKSISLPHSRFGDKFIFLAYKAEVVSEPQIWTETHISSSGGGGYVHPEHGGHVSAPTISSNIIERQRYFVKYSNGNESELRDVISARKGHKIWVIFGGFPEQDKYLIATYNPAIRKYLLENLRYKKYLYWTYLQPWWLKPFLLILSTTYVIPVIFLFKKIKWENTVKDNLDYAVDNFIKIL